MAYKVVGKCKDNRWDVETFDEEVVAKHYQKKCQLIVNGFHKTRQFQRTSSLDPKLILDPTELTVYSIEEID